MKQVPTKVPSGHTLLEPRVSCRDHTDIGTLPSSGRPHPVNFVAVQSAKQLRCRLEGKIPDLVEEQRPAVGFGEGALPSRVRARNAPRSWPNSSLSTNSRGSAVTLIATNGRIRLGPSRCSARAMSSLPVPLSPTTSTGRA